MKPFPSAQINAAVESLRGEMLALLQALIRIPSLPGDELPAQELIRAQMQSLGLALDWWTPTDPALHAHPAWLPSDIPYDRRPNLVGTWAGSGGGHSLILNGHVDVVPSGPQADWQHGPWSGDFSDGRVYGRGSVDMKAGCVVNLMVVKALQRAGVRLKGDLILESVVDEENGGNGTLACVLRGYRADGMIFTEPSGVLAMGIAQRGAQFFRLTVRGQAGGVERQYQLVNPIGKALAVYRAAEAFSLWRQSSTSHPLYDPYFKCRIPLSICKISAGEWPSTIPAACVMEGSIECLPGEDIEAVKESFKRYLHALSLDDPWFGEHPVEVEWFGLRLEPAEISPDHPLVRGLAAQVQAQLGQAPVIAGSGGSDQRLPVLYGGTPALLYGPGGGMIHSVDEYVEFEEVLACLRVLANFAAEWCGVESPS